MARSSEVELCFDSMSDLITNLAGGLILVVMLLLGVTREAPREPEPPKAESVGKNASGEKSTRVLVERLNALQLETAQLDDEVASDDALRVKLEEKAADLTKRIQAADQAAPKK